MTFLVLTMMLIGNSGDSTAVWREAEIWLSGIEGIQMSQRETGDYEISGRTYRESDRARIREFIRRYPEVKDRSRSHQKKRRAKKKVVPTVFLELMLMELKRTALERLGSRLGSPIGVLGAADTKNGLSPVRIPSLRAFVDLALQRGEAKIHAKQSLVTQNGKEAEFLAGGEFPIRVVGENVAHIQYKSFGLQLKFTPEIFNKKKVHLRIESEISELDLGSEVDGLPVILRKKLQTQIFTDFDQMIAIGGLVRSGHSQFVDRIPGLAEIPILGRLFRSEDFRRHRSEAYLFVTPSRLDKAWLPKVEGF